MCSGSLSLWRTGVVLYCGLMAGARGASPGAPASGTSGSLEVTNLSQVRGFASQNPAASFAIALEGDIWWANGQSTRLVFKDDTGVEELEMDLPGEPLRSGQRVRIAGAGTIIQRGAAFQIGSKGAVVDNDGVHGMVEKYGAVFLKAGRQPLRLDWFNGVERYGLAVGYEGPGVTRRPIPDSALFRVRIDAATGTSNWVNGLEYRCYEVNGEMLPDFDGLTPVKTGTASNFDPDLVIRPEHAGLEFRGFLEVPQDGLYRFFTKSDDGSRLFVGTPSLQARVIGEKELPSPRPIVVGQTLRERDLHQWAEVEGKVTFVRQDADGAQLELSAGAGSVRVEIAEAPSGALTHLLNSRIRAAGYCRCAFTTDGEVVPGVLLTPGLREIRLLEVSQPVATLSTRDDRLPVLTTAVEVHRLKREEAQRKYPVRVRGVVTSVLPEHQAFTLQDATRGLYVEDFTSSLSVPPRPGDFLEVEGTTDPSLFAPIVSARRVNSLAAGKLPQPVHPSWDQLMNGSMDAQYVEVAGVVTAVESHGLTLLTSEGVVQVGLRVNGEKGPDELKQYENAQVRLRGCLFASWDYVTHQVKMGEVRINGADVFVDQKAPADLFSTPTKTAMELRLFDPQAGAYQRVRVSGQIVFSRKEEYFMMQGSKGLRFISKKPAPLENGDTVEVVGFPDWSSVFPVLREAVARKTGHAALPQATRILPADLMQAGHDATIVRVEGTLTGSRMTLGGPILELQSGARNFVARLDATNAPELSLPLESKLELTGVYVAQGGNRSAGQDIASFELLLDSPADVRLVARPPWWTLERLLIIVGLLAFVLVVSVLWISQLHRKVEQRTAELETEIQERQRAEQQRLMEQERGRVAQDLHDELGSGLTEVSMLVERARQASAPDEKRGRYLDQMGERAREMVIALDEIVWAMNPRHDSLGSLVSYFSLYAERFLRLANISWRLEGPPDSSEHVVDSRSRHQLFLAFKEALTNVVRHSAATEVCLRIRLEDGQVRLTISDNGRGLEAAQRTEEMDGVENMRARIERVGGRFQVASQPARGTTLSLSVPAH